MTEAEAEFLRIVIMYGVERIPLDAFGQAFSDNRTRRLLWSSKGTMYFTNPWSYEKSPSYTSVSENGLEILKRLGYGGE